MKRIGFLFHVGQSRERKLWSGVVRRVLTASILLLTAYGIKHSIAAEPGEHWPAFSLTAEAITGDIQLSRTRLIFANGESLELSYVSVLKGVSVASEIDNQVPTEIFQIDPPFDPLLLNGNHLCGTKSPPAFISLARFNNEPALDFLIITIINGSSTPDAGIDRNRFCASYTYARKRTASKPSKPVS